mmetsp:Transcript_18698/g.56658  ORF Transcript_18698/g.56658 Transcript_18698/m.56658 type:complete len:560 (-) Transcript_18698:3-1682(-)
MCLLGGGHGKPCARQLYGVRPELGEGPHPSPAAWGSVVVEHAVVEGRRELHLVLEVVLDVDLPRVCGGAAGQLAREAVERAQEVGWGEALDEAAARRRHLLWPQARHGDGGALGAHVVEEAAGPLVHELGAQRPRDVEVAQRVHQVRHVVEHCSAVGDVLAQLHRRAVDGDLNVARALHQLEAGRSHHDVALDLGAVGKLHAARGEALQRARHDGRAARAQRRQEVAVGVQTDPLCPRVVLRREVRPERREARAEVRPLREGEDGPRHARQLEAERVEEDLEPDLGLAVDGLHRREAEQQVQRCEEECEGQREGARPAPDVGRRPLNHDQLAALLGEGRDDRDGRRPRPDHDHRLVSQVAGLPELRVEDAPPGGLKVLTAGEAGQLFYARALILVVAGAGNHEARLDALAPRAVLDVDVEGPDARCRVPRHGGDLAVVQNPPVEPVLLRHLPHVLEDLAALGEVRVWLVRLEAKAEADHRRVGADARVLELVPRPAERRAALEDGVRMVGALGLQPVRGAEAAQPGTDDHDVEALGWDGVRVLGHGLRKLEVARAPQVD